MVAAASPPPSPDAAPGRAHPTYTKMIKHALTELGGCSPRPAIAGYILGRFSGFPASHDLLLSAHLRRLLADGVLRTHGQDYIFAPPEEKRRGPGRPRKSPQASSDTPLLPAKRKLSPTPATVDDDDDPVTKRGPGRPTTHETRAEAASSFSIKRGRGRPRKEKPLEAAATSPTTGACGRPSMDRASAPAVSAEAAGGEEATTFHNVQSGGASSSTGAKRGRGRPRKHNPSAAPAAAMSPELLSSTKRGRGRPRKHKPPEAAANSPATAAAASRGFKRGCGRPSMDRASAPAAVSAEASMDKALSSTEASMEKLAATAAAMYAESGDAVASTGGGQSRLENLAAAVAAMSGQGTKRGRGRPRKEKPLPVAAGVKRSRGRPRKDQSVRPRLVESPYEAFFRDMMAEASATLEEKDVSVSGEKTTHADNGVAIGGGNETRAVADAAVRVLVSGQNAASAPAGAADSDLDPVNLADATASTGIKRPRGRPRKNKPSAAAAADDSVSTGVKRGRGRPRTEKLEEAMPAETGDAAPPTGVKRGRGRPRKEMLEEGMSAETGVAAPTVVKRGRGRPRKNKPSAAAAAADDSVSTGVKRGRGRPRTEKLEEAMPAETGDAAPPTGVKRC